MKERTKLLLIAGVFLAAYFLPLESSRVQRAREHVLLCLVPAWGWHASPGRSPSRS